MHDFWSAKEVSPRLVALPLLIVVHHLLVVLMSATSQLHATQVACARMHSIGSYWLLKLMKFRVMCHRVDACTRLFSTLSISTIASPLVVIVSFTHIVANRFLILLISIHHAKWINPMRGIHRYSKRPR